MTWVADIAFYLKPVLSKCIFNSLEPAQFVSYFDIHREGHFPDLDVVQIAILGVEDSRRGASLTMADAPNEVRQQLYQLFYHGTSLKIADLGNIAAGETPEDTDYALQSIVSTLITHDVMVIVIGGSQELSFPIFAAYEYLETTINLGIIDSQIDLVSYNDALTPNNFLSKIVLHEPSYLFNVSMLGYQTYLNNPAIIELIDKLYFDAHRLGEVTNNLRISEPHIRNSDMISVDMNAVKNASAPGTAQPNGLSGEEICQMMRYAGLSDKTSTIGIFNYDPQFDVQGQTARLIAQMIWCALDGMGKRQREFPLMNKQDFIEYKVHMSSRNDELVFFKSKRSDKWWMNVPYAQSTLGKLGRFYLVPCSYDDYMLACAGEIPDTWWRTYQKLG